MPTNRVFDRQTIVTRDLERNATEVTNVYIFHPETVAPRQSLASQIALSVLIAVIWCIVLHFCR